MSRLSLDDIDELARLQHRIQYGSMAIDQLLEGEKFQRRSDEPPGMSGTFRYETRWPSCSMTSQRPRS
jgi:hypothetical protein